MTSELTFEIIDEDDVEFSRNRKAKKTPSLFDSPLSERTYWGNDKGSELNCCLARTAISKSLRRGIIFDIDDSDLTRVLNKEYKQELKQFQMELLEEMMKENNVIVSQDDNGNWIIKKVGE